MPARRTLERALAALGGLLLAGAAWASPVGFDNTFDSDGRVYRNLTFGASDDMAQSVAIQADGAMVVAGTCQTGSTQDFCIARFLADGSLDPAFGSGGKVSTAVGVGDDVARAVTLDGTKIVVAGSCTQGGETDFCVARYLANGALDATFNGGSVMVPVGLLADQAYAVAMDGTSILVGGECEVAGTTRACLIRLASNGTLDATYGTGGKVILPLTDRDGIRGLAVSGGKAILAARCTDISTGKFCAARLTASGSLDATFGTGGLVKTQVSPFAGVQQFDDPNGVSLMADGRIVVAGQCRDGSFAYHMCALVLNGDGTPSAVVNGDGKVILPLGTASAASASTVATISTNQIYLSGPCTVSGVQRFCVAGLNGLGGLSSSFNGGQVLVDTLNLSVAAVPNAMAAVFNASTGNTEVSVVGSCGGTFAHDFCAARYLQTGSRLTSFGVLGTVVQELTLGRFDDRAEGLVRQADGRIVVAGTCASTRVCVARFNTDGSLDTSFATDGVYLGAAGSTQGFGAKVGLDGTAIVVATAVAGTLRVTRLLASGAPDPSWGGGTGTVAPIPADPSASKIAGVAAVGGGAVVIGFTCGVAPVYLGDFCLVKLTATGALDPTFNAAGTLPGLRLESFGFQDAAHAMAMDGTSIVMAGTCRVSGYFDPCVMRFTSAGALDTTFNGTGKLSFSMGSTDSEIFAISVSAGVITVGGGCTPGSKQDFCVARINANGTLDTTFNGTGIASASMGLFASRVQGLVADGTGVVAAGTCDKEALGVQPDICLARFRATGSLDPDFNDSGTLRTEVGSGSGPAAVTELIRDGSRFVASIQCLPPNGDGVNDFCIAAYLQLPASLPGAPTITDIVAGDTQATVSFVPPVNNGGSTITSFTVTCGTKSATGATSPLTVMALLNGVSVGCTVTATNAAGTGPASSPPVNVTPLRGTSVALSASVNPSSTTGLVSFFASVTGQGPTGTVTFTAGGLPVPGCVGAFPVVSGVATCPNTTIPTPGTYSIIATYSGDSANGPSVSAPLSHTVNATFEQLTVVKLGTGTATVTSAPAGIACGATCVASYSTNLPVTLTATPAAGTVVQSWFGCDGETGNECIVIMSSSRTVQLTLAPVPQFALTVAKAGTGSGTVSSSPGGIACGATCSASFNTGTAVTLTANPAAGSSFAGWSGACAGTSTCQVSMDAAKSVTATFTAIPLPRFALTVAKAGSGTVTSSPGGIACGATCSATFDSGTAVTLTAAPAAGSSFAGWSGACAGTSTCQLSMDAAKGVTATFTLIPPPNPPRLSNIATRGPVQTGDNVMIAGFIIGGSTPKTVLVRARGPSLTQANVPNVLANPQMQLYSGQTVIASNDDWVDAPNKAAIEASGFAPQSARESAILATLNPGAYTAIVTGVGNTTGITIVEVFEVDQVETPLVNIATRGPVQTGDNVMIAGFIIQGDGPQTVVVRARGPSMAGVPGVLANPQLTLYSGQTPIASNDNWGDAANKAALEASGFAPGHPNESAILVTLQPGGYTAIVTGAGGGTGIAIVEVFRN